MSLYTDLKAAGIETDSHESDLYFPDTPASRAILRKHPVHNRNSVTFADSRSGAPWIDVPFAYEPFWEGKTKREPKVIVCRDSTGCELARQVCRDQQEAERLMVARNRAIGKALSFPSWGIETEVADR